jgi:hypothetical protein
MPREPFVFVQTGRRSISCGGCFAATLGEDTVEVQDAHLLNADAGNVQPPAAGPHVGVFGQLHSDLDGLVVFVQEETDFLQLYELCLRRARQTVGSLFRHRVLPSDVRNLHANMVAQGGGKSMMEVVWRTRA